jgi:hypothetical protein
MKLERGDIFCSRNPMMLGKAINLVQKWISVDGKSKYSHSGLITDPAGITFEALWTNKKQNLYSAYKGQQVLIGRHNHMTGELFWKAWRAIKHHEGKWYAGHRLFFFLLCPPLAKFINLGPGVCSELTAKHWYRAGLIDFWSGVYPDFLADMIHNWKDIQVIYEGRL